MGFENFQRSSIFELLRIIAMFAIIAHHLVNHGLTVTLLSKKLFLNTTFEQALFFGGAICGLRRTVLRSKTDAMRSERTDLI